MKTLRVFEQARTKGDQKSIKVYDGHGLFLHVFESGAKVWKHQFRFNGKALQMNIGDFSLVSLTQARERHVENRRLLAAGINPLAHRGERAAADRDSFETLALAWVDHYASKSAESTGDNAKRRVKNDIIPRLGKLTPGSIDALLVSQTIRDIAKRTVPTAKRVFQDLNLIFSWGISRGLATKNPTAEIRIGDLLPKHEITHQKRVDIADVPALMASIRSYRKAQTRSAMLLLAHTTVRTSELIKAKWTEFDLDNALWTIPSERMKKRREHLVPLTAQVLAILRDLKATGKVSEYVLPGNGAKNPHMAENTILAALEALGFKDDKKQTGHGFRGIADTYLSEKLYDRRLIESQLAHALKDQTEAAYNEANHIEERRKMMAAYSAWLEGETSAD